VGAKNKKFIITLSAVSWYPKISMRESLSWGYEPRSW